MASFTKLTERFCKQRAGYKSRNTFTLRKLTDDENLTKEQFVRFEESIKTWLSKIDEINIEIDNICIDNAIGDEDDSRKADLLKELAYRAEVISSLSSVSSRFVTPTTPRPVSHDNTFIKPKLQCTNFDGKDCQKDTFKFKNFLTQFENCVASVTSKASKLHYLRGYLSDYALQLVQHLTITEANYDVAIQLLKDEFYDENLIVNEIFKQITEGKPTYDADFTNFKQYISKTRADVYELKTSYGLDFLQIGTPGNKYLSFVIFSKMPNSLKKEFIRHFDTNYPSVNNIFEKYAELIKTLIITQNKFNNNPTRKLRSQTDNDGNRPTLENFSMKVGQPNISVHCKFCSADGHSMYLCSKYKTHQSREARCKELKLCTLCSSNKHFSKDCYGKSSKLTYACKVCESKGHISALCPNVNKSSGSNASNVNFLYNSGLLDQPYILPIISITLLNSGKLINVNCLFDTGSQRSYFAKSVMQKLYVKNSRYTNVDLEVKTFLGSKMKHLSEVTIDIKFSDTNIKMIPVLVDNEIDLNFNIPGLNKAINNLKHLNYNLAASYGIDSDEVCVQGLIGTDIIQFLSSVSMVKCMHGSAWKVGSGIAPFGNILHFLKPDQVIPAYTSQQHLDFNSVVCDYASCSQTLVNFVMEPKAGYPDSYVELFCEDSMVERKVDNMLDVESLGINNEDTFSDFDQLKVKEFENSILYKDNCYFINLPWYDERVSSVPSNYQVALKVLDKVASNLEKRQLYESYLDVFRTQEKEGIIERINVDPKNFSQYIWIPHRPVVKQEEQVTTKIRPVFNCSLKVNGAYSLNESAYPGVNIMGDLLKLLMHFRSNKFVFLADIRKAFLMIRLRSEKDQNRFCFFLKENNQLLCYRYKTILFGFNASPFILNYLIKYHANKYSMDLCTHMLKHNFYVDNLVKTSNDPNLLVHLYQESVRRMGAGSFDLRSCNSNFEPLRNTMIADGRFIEHSSQVDKVLGYKFNFKEDFIQISENVTDSGVNTKRDILAQSSSIFDPISLCLPVTVRCRILMKELWCLKLNWDDPIDNCLQLKWQKLSHDLNLLCNLKFPRCSILEENSAKLMVFCDASKDAYGCSIYAIQNNYSSLIFAKAKVSPMKSRSLPTLELLGVFLAFKCLIDVLSSYSAVKFTDIFINVDAQIVLSWLLSKSIKSKNLFARNRLKDIMQMTCELQETYDVKINFKYIPSDCNPADLLTRGLSFDKFKDNFDFWNYGPKWIRANPLIWPSSELQCLNVWNKNTVQSHVVCNFSVNSDSQVQPFISFERFSKLCKLIKATSYIFIVRNKLKNLSENPKSCAFKYLIKIMQRQCFNDEIVYLLDSSQSKPPDLVNNLNLFLDDDGILRTDSRLGKVTSFTYDVKHPILLDKHHPLTKLIIMNCHEQCLHLGLSSTFNKLRLSGYWVPKGRQAVKSTISQCFICKKFNTASFKYPKVSDLPKHRVNFITPFRYTGVDFTGHVWVKHNNETKKMYLLIYTCLNIRAVHIDLLEDMTVDSFVMSFVRFSNLYGLPNVVYSDNAQTFISGCKVISSHIFLEEVFSSDIFHSKFYNSNVKHQRIPLYSAWFGSTWERMIRTIKSCLYKSIGRNKRNFFELMTIISDVQLAINTRPLTYRCTDDDTLDIITPNNFLHPFLEGNHSVIFKAPDITSCNAPSRNDVLYSIESCNDVLDQFKKLWHEDYLLSLRNTYKNLHNVQFSNKIQINDIVLIKDQKKSKPFWLMGRILELVPGPDGSARSVVLKNSKGVIQSHSLKHLFPLEIHITDDFYPDTKSSDNFDSQVHESSLNDLNSNGTQSGNTNSESPVTDSNSHQSSNSSNQTTHDLISTSNNSNRPKRHASKNPYIR